MIPGVLHLFVDDNKATRQGCGYNISYLHGSGGWRVGLFRGRNRASWGQTSRRRSRPARAAAVLAGSPASPVCLSDGSSSAEHTNIYATVNLNLLYGTLVQATQTKDSDMNHPTHLRLSVSPGPWWIPEAFHGRYQCNCNSLNRISSLTMQSTYFKNDLSCYNN